jgi:hypothetical protein
MFAIGIDDRRAFRNAIHFRQVKLRRPPLVLSIHGSPRDDGDEQEQGDCCGTPPKEIRYGTEPPVHTSLLNESSACGPTAALLLGD